MKPSSLILGAAIACFCSLFGEAAKGEALTTLDLERIELRVANVETAVREVMPIAPSSVEVGFYVNKSQCIALGFHLDIQEFTMDLSADFVEALSLAERGAAIQRPADPIIDARDVVIWWSVLTYQIDTSSVMDREAMSALWDLNCAGQTFHSVIPPYRKLEISDEARLTNGVRESFTLIDGNYIRVLGEITEGYSERLMQAVLSLPDPSKATVALGSGGGNVGEAVRAARFIRAVGASTELYDTCISSCPIVFLGGVDRLIWSPAPKVGFHMLSVDGKTPIPYPHPVYDELSEFITEMGADRDAFIALMLKALPEEFHYPEASVLCDAYIATWVQRACWN